MMTTTDQATDRLAAVAEQIRAEVGTVVAAVAALLGPSAAHIEHQVNGASIMWAAQLLGDDDKLAGQTVIDLMNVRWPNEAIPPLEWWRTPLGRVVAASTGLPTSDVVSYAIAGRILGCSKQNVQGLVDSKQLTRGPGGRGVTRDSVLARLRGDAPPPASVRTLKPTDAPAWARLDNSQGKVAHLVCPPSEQREAFSQNRYVTAYCGVFARSWDGWLAPGGLRQCQSCVKNWPGWHPTEPLPEYPTD